MLTIDYSTGPSAGTSATTCTPGKTYIQTMLTAFDEIPLNTVLTGKGNDSGSEGLIDQVRAGCAGLKLHEVGCAAFRSIAEQADDTLAAGLGHYAGSDRFLLEGSRRVRCSSQYPHRYFKRVFILRRYEHIVCKPHSCKAYPSVCCCRYNGGHPRTDDPVLSC